ncbi:MAG: glycosyltransferase family 4 protein [Oligoflexia bacterium]|nr:glycosyltransferase family 4 protein [Oligoflexia bacterium]
MKSVCFLSIATHLGGAEKSLLDLVLGIKKNNYFNPIVIVAKDSGLLIDELKRKNINVIKLPLPRILLRISRSKPIISFFYLFLSTPQLFLYLLRLKKAIKSIKPSIIHTTGIKFHIIGGFVAWLVNIPVVWHLRDIIGGFTKLVLRVEQFIFSVKIIANSLATAKSFKKSMDYDSVIYNGFDPNIYFQNKNYFLHERFNIDKSMPIVGIVGVLARWKGQVEFIQMASELSIKNPQVYFAIIGGEIYDTQKKSEYKRFLFKQVNRLGLDNRFIFMGFQKNISEVLNSLSVLVHASIEPEPFGRVIVEAMACGIPVVASRSGGVTEIFEEGKMGLMVDPKDTKQMAEKVNYLLNNQTIANQLAEEGKKEFLRKFTLEKHILLMEDLFKRLAK